VRWRSSRRKGAAPAAVPADPLDRLGTRQTLTAELAGVVAARRPSSLLLLDIDGMLALRVGRGEEHAERVLRLFAERLWSLEHVSCHRIQDDVFGIIVPRAGDPLAWLEGLDVDLTRVAGARVSVGAARVAPGMESREVQEGAIRALRAAKRRGDGSVVDVERLPRPPDALVAREQAAAVMRLLHEGYLRVSYQPIMGLESQRLVGFEAIARAPVDYGLAGPAEAFAIARRLGLVPELDAVCRHAIFSDGAGFDMPAHTRLHIDVSARSLGHRSLTAGVLRGYLREVGLPAERVVLEVGHRDAGADPTVEADLRRLADMGFVLALDGVGAVGADLGLLATGLFRVVKVAGEVIAPGPTSPQALGLVEAVCAFGRRAGAMVVADGVESADALAFVRRFRGPGRPATRIDAAQGSQIGEPQPQARARARPPVGRTAAESQDDIEQVELADGAV
jgi:EAL domain-containing protein (putative c-di-GMP-specific phosphodiesterase class I)/GGDEF domain-containing protein